MNPIVLNRIKLGIYTLTSLGVAWATTMSGVKWSSMGWEEQSCLIAGIIVLWGQTLFAYFDKGAANAADYKASLDNTPTGDKSTKP